MCLRDHRRTRALKQAIHAAVRPRDTVLDIGAGTGILSLFAAQAGAQVVYAIEGDPVLAAYIRRTADANGLGSAIAVVHGDARELVIPEPADVVMCELLDTGLISESLVPVLNAITAGGWATDNAVFLPSAYETSLRAIRATTDMYGFSMLMPRHEWSFYDSDEWLSVPPWGPSQEVLAWSHRFSAERIEQHVTAYLPLEPGDNTLCISGRVELGAAGWYDEFPSMNGVKLLPLPDAVMGTTQARVEFTMGAGLESLVVTAA